MRRLLTLAPIALLVSCRLGGGPSADPDTYVAFDTGAEAAVNAPAPGMQADDAAVTPPSSDASITPDDDVSLPGEDAPQNEPGDTSTGGGCWARIANCDPVHNTGCNPLQQCDIDTSQMSTPTGICVFNNGTEAGGACSMSFVNESCAPGQTCVSGACKAICFCDANCPMGQCCSDKSGPKGFTLCGTCPPDI